MKKIVKISETIVDHIVNEMINVLSYEYYGSLDHDKKRRVYYVHHGGTC